MPYFSKAFLASVPPFNPDWQTDANDFDAAAAFFDHIERTIFGGFSGLRSLSHHAKKYGVLPDNITLSNPEAKNV